jgi:hypothetical protein
VVAAGNRRGFLVHEMMMMKFLICRQALVGRFFLCQVDTELVAVFLCLCSIRGEFS